MLNLAFLRENSGACGSKTRSSKRMVNPRNKRIVAMAMVREVSTRYNVLQRMYRGFDVDIDVVVDDDDSDDNAIDDDVLRGRGLW